MRITAIAARTVRWPIAATGAARGRAERAAVLVEVRGERGIVGLGEAAPLPGLSRDTLDDAEAAIAAFARRAPFEVVARPFDATAPDAAPAMPRPFMTYRFLLVAAHAAPFRILREDAARLVPMIPPAPRFAIETALCDALAREAGVSLATWLAARVSAGDASASASNHDGMTRSRDRGPVHDHAPTRGREPDRDPRRLPVAEVVDDADAARAAYAAGIRCLKIKLAADDPPSRLLAIAAAAPHARLRIDANRSWPRDEVAARLAALANLRIDYVEEPCRDAHQLLGAPLPYRIALDESLADLTGDELTAALASPQLAAVILKPTLLGGLSACLAIAARARTAGVAAIVSHGLEGPIGTAACAELALALASTASPAGDPMDDGSPASGQADSAPRAEVAPVGLAPHAALADVAPVGLAPRAALADVAPVGLASHAALAGWTIQVRQLAADHVEPAGAPGLGFHGLDLDEAVRACPAPVADTPCQG